MQAIDFNDGWSYRHLDADESFTAVRLPHDAMIGKPRHEDAPGGVNTGWFDGRDYEYVKTYAPGPELAGRRLLLEFEGVYHNAEVWVDGVQLAFRPYGYTNFHVDVTDALAAGEAHEIRVVARNADQPNSRWYSGAGIYRPVTLWAGDAGHILPDGITVRTVSATPLPADGPADAVKADAVIEASIETTASGTVAIDIIDASGAVVANAQAVTRDIQPTGRGGEADVVPQGALAAALDAGANAVAVA
uniref:sugar-binding domain-containing protein n=1 Tax=Bifidobacterium pullorum TaxID=78448 RepID=UPI003A8F7F7F